MKNKNNIILIFIAIVPTFALAMDGVRRLGATGPIVTSENINDLMGAVSIEAREAMDTFLAGTIKNTELAKILDIKASFTNADCIRQLLTPVFVQENLQLDTETNCDKDPVAQILGVHAQVTEHKQRDDVMALKLMGAQNLSDDNINYVFHNTCNPNWMIKIAGPLNRLTNLYWAAGVNRYAHYVDEPLNLRNMPTYQTVSEAQVALILRYEIASKGYKHVVVPETYIYRLSSSANHPISDNNCLVISRFIPNLVLLKDRPDLIADSEIITPEKVAELKALIQSGRLWDIKNNLMLEMNTANPRFVLLDNEQRNLTSPQEFSAVDSDVHDRIQATGICDLRELFAERPDILAVLMQ